MPSRSSEQIDVIQPQIEFEANPNDNEHRAQQHHVESKNCQTRSLASAAKPVEDESGADQDDRRRE
jgi:hypothetical protein